MTNEEIKEEANESQDPVADESQLDEPELDESQLDEPELDESQLDNSPTGAQRNVMAPPELKIIIQMRGQHATLGIQKPGTDPHLETIQGDLGDVLREIPDLVERLGRQWLLRPRYPEHRKGREPREARNPAPTGPETARLL